MGEREQFVWHWVLWIGAAIWTVTAFLVEDNDHAQLMGTVLVVGAILFDAIRARAS